MKLTKKSQTSETNKRRLAKLVIKRQIRKINKNKQISKINKRQTDQ